MEFGGSRFNPLGLKDHASMWKVFTDSISGFGYHIANARLFALSQMITIRMEHHTWGDDSQYNQQLSNILMLIDYAKAATAKEKVIYLFTISEWLEKIIQSIEELEWREQKQSESNRAEAQHEFDAAMAQQETEGQSSDPMGEIPF